MCDDSNQAKGFSTVGTTGGLGRLSVSTYSTPFIIPFLIPNPLNIYIPFLIPNHVQGSVIGGYLAQPASKFGPLKKPFFCMYPYSLPCIVGGTFAIISFIGNNSPQLIARLVNLANVYLGLYYDYVQFMLGDNTWV